MKLFPKMELAVKAMALCCPDKEDEKNKSPIARSEVFNETWMLRLTLALIHDHNEKGFLEGSTLERIQKAVKQRWVSEGGLTAAFKDEGATWADAIMGSVKLEKNSKTKRGVTVDISGKHDNIGVSVIEAKMDSALASGITHADDYNQAARNIACLAKLTMKHDNLPEKSAFVVFAPRKKIDNWMKSIKHGLNPNTMIHDAWSTIEAQLNERPKQGKKDGHNPARTLLADTKSMKSAVSSIVKNSAVMSWEEVIESMKATPKEAYETLKWFYEETCAEYGIKPSWSKT